MGRIARHPILEIGPEAGIPFYFGGKKMFARPGEVISSALFANGITTFGRHPRDGSAQGIFCANGQCSQCLVIADGIPVKGCMVTVSEGMKVTACDGTPVLPRADRASAGFEPIRTLKPDVLIIGGGPAGIMAALELAPHGAGILIVDDKHRLGGKLILQTHSFFGTVADCFAGTRGIDIG